MDRNSEAKKAINKALGVVEGGLQVNVGPNIYEAAILELLGIKKGLRRRK